MKTLLFLCVLCFILFGCGCKTDEQKAAKLEKSNQFFEDFMSHPHKEKVVLLSLKYDIEKTKLESVLDEYLSNHDIFYDLMKDVYSKGGKQQNKNKGDLEVNLNFEETIEGLSNKYNIPKNKLSNIIIDYRIWSACEEKGDGS